MTEKLLDVHLPKAVLLRLTADFIEVIDSRSRLSSVRVLAVEEIDQEAVSLKFHSDDIRSLAGSVVAEPVFERFPTPSDPDLRAVASDREIVNAVRAKAQLVFRTVALGEDAESKRSVLGDRREFDSYFKKRDLAAIDLKLDDIFAA